MGSERAGDGSVGDSEQMNELTVFGAAALAAAGL